MIREVTVAGLFVHVACKETEAGRLLALYIMYDKVLGISSQYDRACQYRLAYGLARPVASPKRSDLFELPSTLGPLLKRSDAMVGLLRTGG